MCFSNLLVILGVIAATVNGLAPQRQVLVTYPQEAPLSDLNDYKSAITSTGGQILHEFNLFKYILIHQGRIDC